MDLMKIVHILIDEINQNYKDDIAVMCIYGSYIYNAAHDKSDIDFYFIPKSQRAYKLVRSFLIDDIGFDFWPMSWERAENTANYAQGFVSLIADAKVVWYSSDEDLSRFEALKQKAKNPSIDFNSRACELIKNCEHSYFEVCAAQNFSEQKITAVQFVADMVELIAVLNRTYTHRGWKNSINEVLSLKTIPNQFYDSCQQILFATESNIMKKEMYDLILWAKQIPKTDSSDSKDNSRVFLGFYEEVKSIYNKLYHACDTNDGITAVMAGAALQSEISEMLGRRQYGKFFNDIISTFHVNDLVEYKNIVKHHEKLLRDFLAANKITVCQYATVEEFKSTIR